MYTASKLLGIGKVISQNETNYTILWEEKNKTTSTLKLNCIVYESEYLAEIALEEKEAAQESKVEEMHTGINSGASNWLAEKNKENASKNLPSSLK